VARKIQKEGGVKKMVAKKVLADGIKLVKVMGEELTTNDCQLFEVSMDELKAIPCRLWHDSLPKHLIDRATKLYQKVRDIYRQINICPNQTVDDWVNSFKYDINPEAEIANWEKLVAKFRAKTKGKSLSAEQKKGIWNEIILQDFKERPFIIMDENEIPFA
jgi:hypothetical protein